MMKITAIKAQVKNPERVSIFVDDKYSFSLSLDELVEVTSVTFRVSLSKQPPP